MFIAAMTDTAAMDGVISRDFASARCLVIVRHETRQIVQCYFRQELPEDRLLAEKLVEADCEAVLCGPIEKEPFAIIADEGCVTRYQASGLTVNQALERMDRYELEMIVDHIGGTGCHSGHSDSCGGHPEHGQEDG